MGGHTDRSRRMARWILIGLMALGLVWAAPSSGAAAPESSSHWQHSDPSHSILIAGLECVLAPTTPHVAVHHLQSVDGDFGSIAVPVQRGAMSSAPLDLPNATHAWVRASAPRAPPLEGSA